jgi:hypothetical protein
VRSGRGVTEQRVLVHYGGIRGKIRDGDILLFRGKSWISRIIRRITRSPYSHAAIVAWWDDRLMVLEAVGKGIVVSRMSVVVNQYSGKVELWTTDEDLARTEVIRTAQRLLGKRYSLYKLMVNLRRLVFGRPRHEEADPEAPPDDFVCSEFVSRVWRAGGIDLVGDASDLYTKPSDIARSPRLRKVGGVVRGQPAALTGDSLDRLPTGRVRAARDPGSRAAARSTGA